MRLSQEQYAAVAVLFLANPTLAAPIPQFRGGEQGGYGAYTGSYNGYPARLSARDPNWQQFEQGFKEGFDGVMSAAGTILPAVASVVKRDAILADLAARESGWDKFTNGVETVGKDAWGAVQEVAPLVPSIASIAGKIAARDFLAARDPSWSSFLHGAETVGKDALSVGEKVAPLAMLAMRDPSWGSFIHGAENIGKDVVNVAGKVAPLVKPALSIAEKFAPEAAEAAELVARDPSWSSFIHGAENVGNDVLNVADKVAPLVGPAFQIADKFAAAA